MGTCKAGVAPDVLLVQGAGMRKGEVKIGQEWCTKNYECCIGAVTLAWRNGRLVYILALVTALHLLLLAASWLRTQEGCGRAAPVPISILHIWMVGLWGDTIGYEQASMAFLDPGNR